MILQLLCVALQILAFECVNHRKQLHPTPVPDNGESWTGKWFPRRPDILMKHDNEVPALIEDLQVSHNIPMGVSNIFCDDGKINLTIDWNGNIADYLCLENNFEPNFEQRPLLETVLIPKAYQAIHECMNVSIAYKENIPTFGTHRALWPLYGEYQFVPRQRWLHTLEHGGVVMLYHPCANPYQVNLLRKLVRDCLFRHVITPSTLLNPDMPLALVAWGKRLQMSFVDTSLVLDFIKSNALHGPEKVYADGQYSFGLIQKAKMVSDAEDSILCPNF